MNDGYMNLNDKKSKIERLERSNKISIFFFFLFSLFAALDFFRLNVCSGMIDLLFMGMNLMDVYVNNKTKYKLLEEIEDEESENII